MISLYYPYTTKAVTVAKKILSLGKNPSSSIPTTPQYEAAVASAAARLGISIEEWKRRDVVVRDLYTKCKFKWGDSFYPPTLQEYNEHGKCIIKNIVPHYMAMDKDEWPDNDFPSIITAHPMAPEHRNYVFICTINYPQKDMPTK